MTLIHIYCIDRDYLCCLICIYLCRINLDRKPLASEYFCCFGLDLSLLNFKKFMFTYPTTSPYVFARSWSVRASPFKEHIMKHFVNMKKDLKSIFIANIWSTKYEFWMSLRLLSKNVYSVRRTCGFLITNTVWYI